MGVAVLKVRVLSFTNSLLFCVLNFFHSNPYGAVIWICNWHSIDNTSVFQLLLHNASTVWRFFFSILPSDSASASKLGTGKKFGGETADVN